MIASICCVHFKCDGSTVSNLKHWILIMHYPHSKQKCVQIISLHSNFDAICIECTMHVIGNVSPFTVLIGVYLLNDRLSVFAFNRTTIAFVKCSFNFWKTHIQIHKIILSANAKDQDMRRFSLESKCVWIVHFIAVWEN